MSEFKTGIIDPGEGKSRWAKGDTVTTDPGSPNFLHEPMFNAMFEAGKINPPKPKTRKAKRKKGDDDAIVTN